MNFSNDIMIFDEYINNNYDLSNDLIRLKCVHTLNVVKAILLLCEKMNLSDEDTKLAFYIGLFHDLGRFMEVNRQKVFNNLKFDHGAYSNKILFNDGFINNFNIDKKDYLLIKKAIYYHNKKNLGNNLDLRELFFCKLLRDADRIDIFRSLIEKKDGSLVFDYVSSQKLLDSFYNSKSIDIKDLQTKGDRVILRFGFVKLFSFNKSSELLNELGYFDDYVNSIKVNEESIDLFNELVEDVYKVLKGEKNYVRKKI